MDADEIHAKARRRYELAHPAGEDPRDVQTVAIGRHWFVALNGERRTLAIYEIRGERLFDVTDEDFVTLLHATSKTTVR
jgi:hypothetical protein